ncbi:hypothetical protein BKA69DRAFT_1100046, partial [Paraphysoderma sedebokerense]
MSNPAKRLLNLTLFSVKDCGLCENAKYSILNVQKRVPFEFKEIDINTPSLNGRYLKYMFDVPVLHVQDRLYCMHRVDEAELEKDLKKL